jgi:hypothetical protein
MRTKKLPHLFVAFLLCFACSSEEKALSNKADPPQKTKKAPVPRSAIKRPPYDQPDNHTEPKAVIPDVGPADLSEWQVKSNQEAQSKVEECKGYQALHAKNPEKISIALFKEISPSQPYWIFAIQEKSDDKTTILNYCTLTGTTLNIQCDAVGQAVCP